MSTSVTLFTVQLHQQPLMLLQVLLLLFLNDPLFAPNLLQQAQFVDLVLLPLPRPKTDYLTITILLNLIVNLFFVFENLIFFFFCTEILG